MTCQTELVSYRFNTITNAPEFLVYFNDPVLYYWMPQSEFATYNKILKRNTEHLNAVVERNNLTTTSIQMEKTESEDNLIEVERQELKTAKIETVRSEFQRFPILMKSKELPYMPLKLEKSVSPNELSQRMNFESKIIDINIRTTPKKAIGKAKNAVEKKKTPATKKRTPRIDRAVYEAIKYPEYYMPNTYEVVNGRLSRAHRLNVNYAER
uniref:Uncharacterized protein n=1 Tax=Rhabditophanes sp. KR3021 TaxID=114890 RepID=A0AC35UD23_9BILA